MSTNEGWGWILNSQRLHYFRDGRSLCRKWAVLGDAELSNDSDDVICHGGVPDDCVVCKKKRAKEVRT